MRPRGVEAQVEDGYVHDARVRLAESQAAITRAVRVSDPHRIHLVRRRAAHGGRWEGIPRVPSDPTRSPETDLGILFRAAAEIPGRVGRDDSDEGRIQHAAH